MNLARFEALRASGMQRWTRHRLKKVNQLPSRPSRIIATKLNIPRTLLSRENFHLTWKQQ